MFPVRESEHGLKWGGWGCLYQDEAVSTKDRTILSSCPPQNLTWTFINQITGTAPAFQDKNCRYHPGTRALVNAPANGRAGGDKRANQNTGNWSRGPPCLLTGLIRLREILQGISRGVAIVKNNAHFTYFQGSQSGNEFSGWIAGIFYYGREWNSASSSFKLH